MKTVLVLGGSGYLGQFLVQDLARTFKVSSPLSKLSSCKAKAAALKTTLRSQVGFTHHSTSPPTFEGTEHAFWLDLTTADGLQHCFDILGPVDVIINCAAVSSPAACEKDVGNARSLNVPSKLLDALDQHKAEHNNEPLLIQLSTDQVYDGSKAGWQESDACNPVNAYGQTKHEAELLIQERWPNHVILRSSIIYGPQSPVPVSRVLFLQFISSGLRQGKSATFFEDEFRCPIYVKDILRTIRQLINQQDSLQHRLFNMGGPERLSRLEMAYITAECWNLDRQYIIPALSASVKRGVTSPADISMDSSLLQQELKGVHFTRLQDALFDIAQSSTERQDGLNSTTERLGQ